MREHLKSYFPIQPYEPQLDLACEIYTSLLEQRKVTILQSPTGSGKSLSVIISVFQWLKDHNMNIDNQFKKATTPAKDLPNWFSKYSPAKCQQPDVKFQKLNKKQYQEPLTQLKLKVTKDLQIIYTTRTHSQIQQWIQEISKSKYEVNLTCLASRQQLCLNQKLLKQSGGFLNKLNHLCKNSKCSYVKEKESIEHQPIMDIEDLRNIGSNCTLCPYYFTKSISKTCDVICIPYQLLMESLDQFQNPIVIVDEAHNFSEALLEKSSVNLAQIQNVIKGLHLYQNQYENKVKSKTSFLLNQTIKIAKNFEHLIEQNQRKELEILDVLVQLGCQNLEIIKFIKFLQEVRIRISNFIDTNADNIYGSFDHFVRFIVQLMQSNKNDAVLYIEKGMIKVSAISNQKNFNILKAKVRNLILVGGTLEPLNELQAFEDIVFKSYPHIIPQENCQVLLLTNYDDEIVFSQKEKENNSEYLMKQMVRILNDLGEIVNQGIVSFVQSYKMMEQFKTQSQELKRNIYFDDFKSYKQSSLSKSILLSVAGGTLSEGINFSDDLARAVVVFGVPFPNLDSYELQQQMKKIEEYYENVTMRTVNQSIGRVIRHKNDYGLIILVDNRFMRLQKKLSGWLQNRVSIIKSQKELKQKASQFFAR